MALARTRTQGRASISTHARTCTLGESKHVSNLTSSSMAILTERVIRHVNAENCQLFADYKCDIYNLSTHDKEKAEFGFSSL